MCLAWQDWLCVTISMTCAQCQAIRQSVLDRSAIYRQSWLFRSTKVQSSGVFLSVFIPTALGVILITWCPIQTSLPACTASMSMPVS